MKRTLLIIIALFSLLTVPAMAYELDPDYSGFVDEFSGRPVDENAAFSDADIVALDADSYYDRLERMFVYQIAGTGSEIRCSAADGMMTNDSVTLSIPDGVDYTLLRDGQQVPFTNLTELYEEGIYDLKLTAQSSGQIRFTIVTEKTADVVEYRLPDNFEITEVLRDGNPVSTPSGMVELTDEGYYQISYRNLLTGIPYQLVLPIDHTAPTLALEAVVDGVAKGPVDISDVEPGASLYIELDGEKEAFTTELTKSGAYVVTVTDQAGNASVYKFTLQVYFNTSSILFFIVFPALIVGLVLYLVYSRKHLRVR